jgi:tripartite-type tricarboxylate transporter receptor subunit TctC
VNGAEATTTLLGGHVEATTQTMSVVWDQIRAGKIRFIMVYSDKRYYDMQYVPTVEEFGISDAAMPSYLGIYVRKDVLEPIKKVLSDLCKKVYDDPEFWGNIEKLGD